VPTSYAELTGKNPGKPTTIDLRGLIADHARAAWRDENFDEHPLHPL
jgi:hypothetical protein